MSRYRAIHCLIWNDDKFPFASERCQLVFFHLLTTPMSTPFGLYKASLEALAAEKRLPLKAYREAFTEAFAKGFVRYDERHQVILIPRFLKYNQPNNPNVLKAWKNIFDEIPDCDLKVEFHQTLKAFMEGFGEGFRKAFAEAWGKPMPIQEQEQEQEQEKDSKDKSLLRSTETSSDTPNGKWPEDDKWLLDFLESQDILTLITPHTDYEWWAELSYIIPWPTQPWLEKQFAKMQQWCRDNPRRKPTLKGTGRFMSGWLERSYNKERTQNATPTQNR